MCSDLRHTTVLLDEAVAALNIRPSGVYLDGTYGRGGHSAKIIEQLNEQGRLLVIDKDPEAIAHARLRYQGDTRLSAWHGSFSDFPQALAAVGLPARLDGLLLDLGVSSPQLDAPERGFSFMREGALDMRMNPQAGLSAREWLMQATEKEIADTLWQYGEERFSRQIARNLVRRREVSPLESTLQLADWIAQAVPKREPGKHPATRSFQAIRIKINRELEDVERCLQASISALAPGGRLAVISFHSLEDRMVKHFMRDYASPPQLPKGLPVLEQSVVPVLRLIGKAVRPSMDEVAANVRARSATLRIAEKN